MKNRQVKDKSLTFRLFFWDRADCLWERVFVAGRRVPPWIEYDIINIILFTIPDPPDVRSPTLALVRP